MSSHLDTWLAAACADAEHRGLPELKPLLESLARSTAGLRAADAAIDARGPDVAPETSALDSDTALPDRTRR